jgi:radical SAM protein with 4Fe4S-binding SPASM domain
MIQCTLYAYILEKSRHVKVTSFEYRYLRPRVSVYSTKDGFTMDTHYQNLENTLIDLKHSLETGEFKDQDKKVCKDCYFKDVCSKNKS